MSAWTSSPFFGLALSIAMYAVGVWLQKKLKSPLANPLLIASALCIAVLKGFRISFDNYYIGGDMITMLLAPATAVLALSVYRQMDILKKHFLPVLIGCTAGSGAAMSSVYLLCRLFKLDEVMLNSLLSKSVTTPIAVSITATRGGIESITVAAVVVTGVLGAVVAPFLIKLFRIGHPVAQGVAIGTSSHAAGTSKAVELGEIQGAMSSVAIGVAGVITSIIALFI